MEFYITTDNMYTTKTKFLLAFFVFFATLSFAQFPNPGTLSTGQGAVGSQDPIWQCSPWSTNMPGNPMFETYGPTLINNNCAPGSWVDPSTLAPPMNNANWITGTEADCANNSVSGYRYFRLTLNLPPECNGNDVTVQGNYILNLDGYVDNYIHNVFINGNPQGISGGNFAPGSQLNILLDGPWQVGTNFVDVLIENTPGGTSNPYGLLLVANANNTANMDSDGDGISDLDDLCPCEFGTNVYGCPDPIANTCDIDLIRTTFLNAGCLELPLCYSDCSMYFLNPNPNSGSAAQAFAQMYGANLISVQDAAENECVINELNRIGQDGVIWIGFNDEQEEGNFVWYDQAPVTYANWAPGEPNNTNGDEGCTQIYPDGMWNDLNCNTANAKSVIEVNLCPLINTDDIVICENEPAVIAADNPILGSNPYTYSWNNGATTQSQTVPSVNGTYIVVVTDRYSCSGSDTMTVTAKPVPTVVPSDTLICTGESTNISVTSDIVGTTFTWTNNSTGVVGASDGTTNAISQTLNTTGTTNGTVVYSVTPTFDGCTGTTVDFNVTVSALPILTFTPATAAVCIEDTVALSVSGATSYTWFPATSLTVSTGANVGAFPTANQTYTVVGENADGCENTNTINVTANPKPTPVIDGDTEYCAGTTATIETTQTYTSYSWSNGATTASIQVTEADNPITVSVTDANGCTRESAVYSVTEKVVLTIDSTVVICADESVFIHGIEQNTSGLYSVTLTGVNGCDSTSNITLVVNPLPIINAGIDVAVCQDSSVILTATGAQSIIWNNGVSNNVPFVPTATNTYVATGTDGNGCVNTDTVEVVVNLPIIVDAGMQQEICIGEPVILAATPVNIGSTYTWTGGINDGVTFNPTQTNQYFVQSVDVNGCISYDSVVVIVNPLPIIEAGDAIFGCENDILTLTAQGAGVGGNYVWTPNVTNGVSFSATVGSVMYYVTGTDANTCQNSDSVLVDIQAYPVVVFTATQNAYCTPVIGTFTNLTQNVQNCVWTFDNGASATGCGTVTETFNFAGSFGASLQVESSNGCVSILYMDSLLTIDEYPNASFTFSPDKILSGDPIVTFNNTTTGATSYTWSFGDETGFSNEISPVHTYPLDEGAYYTVELIATSPLGCVDTAYTTIKVYEDLIFYVPNTFTPDGNQYNQTFSPIFTSGFDPYDYTLIIFNRWGESVFESHDATVGWNGTYGVGGNECASGTYSWKIEVKTLESDERKSFHGHVNLLR